MTTSSPPASADVFIISDLHISDGGSRDDFTNEARAHQLGEQRSDDADLADFVRYLTRRRPSTLIVNGDFIDFIQIELPPEYGARHAGPTLDVTEAQSLAKLELVFAAHAPVFDALAEFVSAGHTLRFHYGNHDIDLFWPRVQERIRERLGRPGDIAAIRFDWSYHAGGLYVEHGNQADRLQAFPAPAAEPDTLAPFPTTDQIILLDPQAERRLVRNWGNRLVEDFWNAIEAQPGLDRIDNAREMKQALILCVLHFGLRAARGEQTAWQTLRPALAVLCETINSFKRPGSASMTEADVVDAAEFLGFQPRVVLLICSLILRVGFALDYVAGGTRSALPRQGVRRGGASIGPPDSLAEVYAQQPLLADDAALAAQLEALQAEQPVRGPERVTRGFIGDRVSAVINKHIYAPRPPQDIFIGYAQRRVQAAPQIQAVCFGHTHDPLVGTPLSVPGTNARYFNSGAWVPTILLEHGDSFEQMLRKPPIKGRDYLYVRQDRENGLLSVRHLRWPETPNDEPDTPGQ